MKKAILSFISLFFLLFVCTGCEKFDYSAYLSDVRSDLFRAETDEFTVTLSCVSREYPYASDGVAAKRTNLVEIVLSGAKSAAYEIYVLDGAVWGGEMSFRNVTDDYYYSKGVSEFPAGSVSLRVQWDEETRELNVSSVKNENTLSVEEALQKTIAAESAVIKSLTRNQTFYGEIYVRLLRRDKNYYYAGIVDTNGKMISLLLDSETGEVLARHESG